MGLAYRLPKRTPIDNVKALKNLAVHIIGGTVTTGDIPYNTIPEILAFIAANVEPQSEPANKTLIVTCVAGTETGTTIISDITGFTNPDRLYLVEGLTSEPPRGAYIPPEEIYDMTSGVMPAIEVTVSVTKIPFGVNLPVGTGRDGETAWMIELDEDNCIIAAGQFTYTVKLT